MAWVSVQPAKRITLPSRVSTPKPAGQELARAHQRWLDRQAIKEPPPEPDLSKRALRQLAKGIVKIEHTQHHTATVMPHQVCLPHRVLEALYAEADQHPEMQNA